MARQDFDEVWNRYMGRDVSPAEYAGQGWDMARILGDLSDLWDGTPDELSGPETMDVANTIAAGLEERGLLPTAETAELETVTLTTAHAASSYGRPVLELDGQAYGPADMTPAGVNAAELVATWARRFIGRGPYAWLDDMPRNFGVSSPTARDAGQDLAGARALLRQMLTLYEGQHLAPPAAYTSYWQAVRAWLAGDPGGDPADLALYTRLAAVDGETRRDILAIVGNLLDLAEAARTAGEAEATHDQL